jgi:choline dehydrogenase-like flavoprotein
MIVDGATVDAPLAADVAIVGAGPAGIVTALELASSGVDVVLVESGRDIYDPVAQALGDAAEWNRELHAPMSMATRRQVGGASAIWGGRCVPYDPVDFDPRPWITDARWPVTYEDVSPYFQRACDWFVCGRAVFDATETGLLPPSLVPGLPNSEVRSSALERWSLPTHFGREYQVRLESSGRVRLVTGATCTRIAMRSDGAAVERLECRTSSGLELHVRGRTYVVACGGLEGTRLLLASPGLDGRPVGDHSGHLGRWYMGHVEGVVSNVRLDTPPRATIYGYERDLDGVYVRRRISFTRALQLEEELPNVTSWLVHPEPFDAGHRSGVLSAAYLALASPLGPRFAPAEALRLAMTGHRVPGVPHSGAEKSPLARHAGNVLRHPVATTRFTIGFGSRRFLARGRRAPGFAVYNAENRYPLQYHGEHRPHPESRVKLADERDALGMPRLSIDVRFSDADVEGIVHAHRRWDEYLRRHRVGRLEYPVEDVGEAVSSRLGAGFHQSGTTRMSATPDDGVVDADLAVHGVRDLHVLSSSTFPTSSQANSTFMIVVFALRLADHLRGRL